MSVKNRFLGTVLAVFICLLFAAPVTAAAFQGSGTADSPYLISSVEDLKQLGVLLHNDEEEYKLYSVANYRLTNPINLGNAEWTPIGKAHRPFSGSFDGNFKEITGLRISKDSLNGVGLFGYVTGLAGDHADIKNLVLVDADVSGGSNVGGIAGFAGSTDFTNCKVTGTVTGIGNNVGAIAGTAHWASISGCTAEGEVAGVNYIGGLVGFSKYTEFSSSSFTGDVTAKEYAGGITGYAWNQMTFDSVTADGSVTAEGSYAGGITGYAVNKVIISNCNAKNDVTGNRDVGGLVGYAEDVSIQASSGTGKISGNENVGEVIGSGTLTSDKNETPAPTSSPFPMLAVLSGAFFASYMLGRKLK